MAELAAAMSVAAAAAAIVYFSVSASQSVWKASAIPIIGASR